MKDLSEIRQAFEIYKWALDEIKKLEGQRDEARSTIEEFLGDDQEGSIEGRKALTLTEQKRTTFNEKLAVQMFPVLKDIPRSETKYRRLRLVGEE